MRHWLVSEDDEPRLMHVLEEAGFSVVPSGSPVADYEVKPAEEDLEQQIDLEREFEGDFDP